MAVEVAERICELTKQKLLGTRSGRLERTSRLFTEALREAISEVLAPEHPLDLLEYVHIIFIVDKTNHAMFLTTGTV